MAKRQITFDDYEGDQYDEYMGEDPRVGVWYTGEVVRGRYDEPKDQMIWFIRLVDHPDYEGWVKGFYAPFDGGGKFKSQDFAKAIQGGQQKPLAFDPEVEAQVGAIVKKAKRIKFKTGDYNDRITIEKIRPLIQGVGGTKTPGPGPSAEAELPGDTDAGDEPVEDYTEGELAELSVEELVEIATEEFEVPADEMPVKGKRDRSGAAYKKALVDLILDEQDGDEGDDEAEGESTEPADDEFEDGFDEGEATEPEPEPAPAPRARRSRAAAAAPAKAAPAAAPATTRRRRG